MKKLVLTAVCTLAIVGLALAEDYGLRITKISDDGTTVTGTKTAAKAGKGKGGNKGGEEITVKIASGVQVFKGKFDMEAKSFVKEGDDLKLSGLKSAILAAEHGNVMVGGKALTEKDMLELTVKDGKPMAKLNGTAIEMDTVRVAPKGPLATQVTTDDSGTITSVVIGGGFGGGNFKKKTGN